MLKNLPLRNIGVELVFNTNYIANFIHSEPALTKDASLPTPVPIEPLPYDARQYLICSFPVLYAAGAGAGAGGGAGAGAGAGADVRSERLAVSRTVSPLGGLNRHSGHTAGPPGPLSGAAHRSQAGSHRTRGPSQADSSASSGRAETQ